MNAGVPHDCVRQLDYLFIIEMQRKAVEKRAIDRGGI